MNMFFVVMNFITLSLNLYLYYIDIKYNGGVLDRVNTSEEESDKAENVTKP